MFWHCTSYIITDLDFIERAHKFAWVDLNDQMQSNIINDSFKNTQDNCLVFRLCTIRHLLL